MQDSREGLDQPREIERAPGPFTEREVGLLRQVLSALDELGVTSWLDQGSLLGITRDGRLIPWDDDIDLGVWNDHVCGLEWRLEVALRRCLQGVGRVGTSRYMISIKPVISGEYLPVSIQRYYRRGDDAVKWHNVPPRNWFRRQIAEHVLAPIGMRLVKTPGARLADTAAREAPPGHRSRAGSWLASALGRVFHWIRAVGDPILFDYLEMTVSAAYFDRLRPVMLGDLLIAVPADTEAYLVVKYGSDWCEPKRDWVWWEQDGAIVEKR